MNGQSAKIAALNDLFRTTFTGGRIVMTRRVGFLDPDSTGGVILKVREFSAFTPDNDPHGEHDFGKIEHDGEEYFWKIDYYDPTVTFGSEDPADPSKTVRVLTVMHVSEY